MTFGGGAGGGLDVSWVLPIAFALTPLWEIEEGPASSICQAGLKKCTSGDRVFRQWPKQHPHGPPTMQACGWPAGGRPCADKLGPPELESGPAHLLYNPSSSLLLCSWALQPQFRGVERPWGQRPGTWRGYYSSQWFQ